MKSIKKILIAFLIVLITSCSHLDIVPDNVADIEYAFRMRSTAERFLYTCYSYMPNPTAGLGTLPIFGADEAWVAGVYETSRQNWLIAAGRQNINNAYSSPWFGTKGLWEGINQCNIFLDNIHSVPGMNTYEQERWAAEVKFLKAYYHFVLFQHFGPIPIKDKNVEISASVEEVRDPRQPVDEVVEYIVKVMDEVIESRSLPDQVFDENSELGRITQPIAMGIKAKVLVYAASPLFNGNTEYANFVNKDGTQLFNQTYSEEKWQKAADALKEAIDKCHALGYELYEYEPTILTQGISYESKLQMNARGTLTERWNKEIIWAQTNTNTRTLQVWSAPRGLESAQMLYTGANGSHGATLNTAYMYYTKNGVPINEDKTWDYAGRLDLKTATEEDKYRIKPGYTTVKFHFDREPRFYGSLGFDGGIWYGNGKYNDADLYWLEMKSGQFLGKQEDGWHPFCGYFIKKLINVTNYAPERGTYNTTNWPWVLLRLGDLYLLYAEAMNELNGPNPESIHYLNLIRAKAGIPDVETSWSNFSINPDKYQTKVGLREIIHNERTIEMLFEGERFWDLRRWKTAPRELNQSILGWHTDHSTAQEYYRERAVYRQTFSLKDYLWPIRESDLIRNTNLVQNPGW